MTWQVWVRTSGASGPIWVAVQECASEAAARGTALALWLKHRSRPLEDYRIGCQPEATGDGGAAPK